MKHLSIFPALLLNSVVLFSQGDIFYNFLADSTMEHAQVSFCVIDAGNGDRIIEHDAEKSLIPGSVLKLFTTAAALEILGPDHRFRTLVGYSGKINRRTGILDGNIVIIGGGDPCLGSENFSQHYGEFADHWVREINNAGIKKINGRVITDDSYFDYRPLPAKWLWEDIGNYYGAGAYGLSVYDNTCEILLGCIPGQSKPVIKGFSPEECRIDYFNRLSASGTKDEGYVFAAPYTETGSLEGTIPDNEPEFILKGSIADPPLLMARIIDRKLKESGTEITCPPSTTRLTGEGSYKSVVVINEIFSPCLKDIIEVTNHKSINLYAEHLLKEMGRECRGKGTSESGLEVITGFIEGAVRDTKGIFMEDGSGLSLLNAISSEQVVALLEYMKRNGKYFKEFYSSFPEAGKEGTLRNYFKDPLFGTDFKVKSGSMTRVRGYAGYLTALSGKELIFCILVNNFDGSSGLTVSYIEEILKDIIKNQ